MFFSWGLSTKEFPSSVSWSTIVTFLKQSLQNSCVTRSFRNIKLSKSDSPSTFAKLTAFTGLSAGFAVLNYKKLHCNAGKHRTRLDGQQPTEVPKTDVDFDWTQFAQLLWEDVLSLALAVLVVWRHKNFSFYHLQGHELTFWPEMPIFALSVLSV